MSNITTDIDEGMRKVYYDYEVEFKHHISRNLSQYFDTNLGGFQAQAFITQILEYAGPHPGLACYKMFGKRAQNTIANMMHDCAEVMNAQDTGR